MAASRAAVLELGDLVCSRCLPARRRRRRRERGCCLAYLLMGCDCRGAHPRTLPAPPTSSAAFPAGSARAQPLFVSLQGPAELRAQPGNSAAPDRLRLQNSRFPRALLPLAAP